MYTQDCTGLPTVRLPEYGCQSQPIIHMQILIEACSGTPSRLSKPSFNPIRARSHSSDDVSWVSACSMALACLFPGPFSDILGGLFLFLYFFPAQFELTHNRFSPIQFSRLGFLLCKFFLQGHFFHYVLNATCIHSPDHGSRRNPIGPTHDLSPSRYRSSCLLQ